MKYEYRYISASAITEKELNNLGSIGFKLISHKMRHYNSSNSHYCIFIREINTQ